MSEQSFVTCTQQNMLFGTWIHFGTCLRCLNNSKRIGLEPKKLQCIGYICLCIGTVELHLCFARSIEMRSLMCKSCSPPRTALMKGMMQRRTLSLCTCCLHMRSSKRSMLNSQSKFGTYNWPMALLLLQQKHPHNMIKKCLSSFNSGKPKRIIMTNLRIILDFQWQSSRWPHNRTNCYKYNL